MSLKSIIPVQGKMKKEISSHFSFEWTIEDFCFCSKHTYVSPSFTSGSGNHESIWNLRLETFLEDWHSYHTSYKKKYPTLKLKLEECYEEKITIQLLDATSLASFDSASIECKTDKECVIYSGNHNISPQVKPGTLTIKIQIVDPGLTKFVRVDNHLLEDLTLLWRNGRHSDIIILVEGHKIHAHKSILAIRCPEFLQMIERKINRKESDGNEVEITDMDHSTMSAFLKFLYTGNVYDIEYVAKKLLVAARKYNLGDLTDVCYQKMEESLTLDNAIDTLVVADNYKNHTLKASALKLITKNIMEFKKMPDVDSFEEDYPHLLEEILVLSNIVL